ncbi:MAG: hypothetical protein JXA21_10755 [Anaerolineae bacterium]|nr:hypothetical protein [Anaerolineae bacterium]
MAYAEGLQDAAGADHVVFLGETTVPAGGWIAGGSESENNRVYLADNSLNLVFGDYAIITVKKTDLPAEQVHPRLYQWFEAGNCIFSWYSDAVSATLVPHPGTLPPAFAEAGETCLQMTFPEGNSGWFGQYIFHSYDEGEGQWYGQLIPGAHYRASVWLRQEGLPGGAVRFVINGPYELAQQTPWTVTGEWQQYTYDFVGPDYPTGGPHAGLGFEVTGPGTVWFDNFQVYHYDAAHNFAPFTPNRVSFDEMMAALPLTGAKPAIRFYPTSYAGHGAFPGPHLRCADTLRLNRPRQFGGRSTSEQHRGREYRYLVGFTGYGALRCGRTGDRPGDGRRRGRHAAGNGISLRVRGQCPRRGVHAHRQYRGAGRGHPRPAGRDDHPPDKLSLRAGRADHTDGAAGDR